MAKRYDYTTVDALKEFRLGRSANLWAGVDPKKANVTPLVDSPESTIGDVTASPVSTLILSLKIPPQNSYDIFQVLKQAMSDGELPAPPDGKITKMTLVSRDALIQWAKKMRSEHYWPLPPFLFPEERPSNTLAPANAEGRCCDWLEGLMRSKPKRKTKKEYLEEARNNFHCSKPQFERAWAAADKSTNAGWSTPGRPRRA